MDSFILSSAMSPEPGKSLLLESKQWIEIPDANGASYTSGRVTFNLDSVANSSDSYFNAKETFVQIPLNLAVEFKNTTAGATTSILASDSQVSNAFIASLKNGSYQIINSLNFKLNGNEIITHDQFENVKINYKILSSWSQDDVVKRGDEIGFALDTVDAFNYDPTTIGLMNNTLNEYAVFVANNAWQNRANYGRRRRMEKTSRTTNNLFTNMKSLTSDDEQRAKYIDTVSVNANGATTTVNYTIMASLRLSDLHPFFEKMPLIRGASMYLALGLNVNAIHSFNLAIPAGAAANTGCTFSSKVSVQNQSTTTPFMLSSIGGLNSFSTIQTLHGAGSIGSVKACIAVRQVPTSIIPASQATTLSQCLFQACYVKMAPTYQIEYVRNPNKEVSYEECYAQLISGVPVGESRSQLISGTYSRLRKVVVMPYLNASANADVSPAVSCFTSEPATCSPLVGMGAIDQYNVRVGINNVYPQNIQYSWQNYLQEVQGDNAVHGGIDSAMASGLISQKDWETAYSYRVTNLSRKPELQDLNGSQITVSFKNSSTKVMDYLVLVYYEKTIGLEVEKGLVVL